MRDVTDTTARVIVAMLVGAAVVGLMSLVSRLLPPGGLADTLGGWPLLAAQAALLCGLCALAVSLALRWRLRHARTLVIVGLAGSALIWGAVIAAASVRGRWTPPADWRWLADAIPTLAPIGAALLLWLLLFAALAGALAGLPIPMSAARRALTPLWLAPLWGAGVSVVYGLLVASVFYSPPCPTLHCYGLDPSPWRGLPLGIGAGLQLGWTLTLALWLALVAHPAHPRAPDVVARSFEA